MQTVKIKSIKKLSKKEDVYNMEVDKYHNFSVNGGYIVHNCLDALRYAFTYIMEQGEVRAIKR